MALVDELGFGTVDAGSIDESWRQQPGTPVCAADLDRAGAIKAPAAARPEREDSFKA
jgi:predicted dinucleotide-binding enzyme